MLRLEDQWVWDSWVADDGEHYHLYFLQAPRSLGDPALRHTHASIGHAVSTDLTHWEHLGQALGPGDSGFDDLAVWTGSVLHDGRQWRMFYTAISTAGHHVFDQRIGSVVSDDLHHWQRSSDQPVLRVDRQWYKTLDLAPPATSGPDLTGSSETWRDPLVFADPNGEGWHMLLTARSVESGRNDDGVVAHARSHDLTTWRVGPPLSRPGTGFGQLEVLQSKVIDGRGVLVFTCHPQEMTADRVAGSGEYCTWSVPSPGVTGPFDISQARPFTAEPDLFAAPLVRRRDGSWVILGFHNLELEGGDGFEICDPIAVGLDDEGYLTAL